MFLAGTAESLPRQTACEPVELAKRNDVSALSAVNAGSNSGSACYWSYRIVTVNIEASSALFVENLIHAVPAPKVAISMTIALVDPVISAIDV
jgi:hypothetical protein